MVTEKSSWLKRGKSNIKFLKSMKTNKYFFHRSIRFLKYYTTNMLCRQEHFSQKKKGGGGGGLGKISTFDFK